MEKMSAPDTGHVNIQLCHLQAVPQNLKPQSPLYVTLMCFPIPQPPYPCVAYLINIRKRGRREGKRKNNEEPSFNNFCLKSHRKRTTHTLLTTMSITAYLRFLLVSWILLPSEVISWIVPQPRANVWVTLAKALQQDHMCPCMGSVNDPLSSCLVGIPLREDEPPFSGQVP